MLGLILLVWILVCLLFGCFVLFWYWLIVMCCLLTGLVVEVLWIYLYVIWWFVI